jgi:SAM-dependent methyltransferase
MQLVITLAVVFIVYVIWKYWTLLVGAGYDPAPMDKVYKMLQIAQVNADDIVYDLGSGDGRVVIAAARQFGARAVGIEIDPFRFIFAECARLLSGQAGRINLKYGDFFKASISEATVVTLFLYGPTNNRLKEKFLRELHKGTRIVSYTWRFDDWKLVDFLPEDRIFLYVL